MKWIIRTVFLMMLSVATAIGEDLVNVPDADSEPSTKKATKEEAGILSSMLTWYTQVRNAVKYAYDEIQYFRGIKGTWEDMKEWWGDSKAKMRYLKQSVVEFPLEDESIFIKFEKAEEIFDRIDDLALNQTAKFNDLATDMEFYIDTLIENPYMDAKGSAHRVIFAPTTNQIAEKLTYWSEKVPWQSVGKTQASLRKQELADYAPDPEYVMEQEERKDYIYNQITDDTQDEEIVKISKELAAHVLANSKVYEQWARQAARNAGKLEMKFKDADVHGMNELELQTCWWMLEQMNATSKQITHSELELKAYLGALGVDIYEFTERKAATTMQALSAAQLEGK